MGGVTTPRPTTISKPNSSDYNEKVIDVVCLLR